LENLESKFGLKVIPFKSQGSETGKYQFIPSESFNELIAEIEKIREQKNSGAIIIQGPQGSGKTATRNGIVKAFSQKSGVAIIAVYLSSLDLSDLTWSIIDTAKEQNLINDEFQEQIGYSPGQNIEKPKLEKIITRVIEEILSKNEFGILIIDEFDIISQPTFHDTHDQTIFLHNITNILNSISESKIVQEKSFCTILAQTDKSSQDFRDYISNRHTPLASRLKKNIDIEYNFDETKQIILKRLEAEHISGFAKSDGNELFPLDEEIIKFLFKQINNLTKTPSMIAFRDMEQILHDSIEKSLEQDLPKVEMNIVEEIFNQAKEKMQQVKPETRRISPETSAELGKLMIDVDQSAANNLYLEGIKTAMKTWETSLYKSIESEGATTRLIPHEENKIFISSIKLELQSTSKHYKTIFWYNTSKYRNDAFTDDDFKLINSILEKNKEERYGCQFSILTIFTDSPPPKNETELQNEIISSVDKIYFRNNLFKKAIIGIRVSNVDEERRQFRDEWDKHLHSICTDRLGETLHDIDKEFKEQHKILIQILYAKSIIGEKLKQTELTEIAKEFTNKRIQSSFVNEIKTFDFADEELNTRIPRSFYALKNLIRSDKSDEEILQHFTNKEKLSTTPYAVQAAEMLKIIDEDKKLINVESLKQEISDDLIEKLKSALPTNTQTLSVTQRIIKLLIDSFKKIDEENNYFKKVIVLGFIKEQAVKSLEDLSNTQSSKPEEEQKGEGTREEGEGTREEGEGTREEEKNSIIINSDTVLEVCQEILKEKKLPLKELKKKIKVIPGFEDQSKWVPMIFQLIHDQKILLSVE